MVLFRAEPPTWPTPALKGYSLVTHTKRVPTHRPSQMKMKPLQVIEPKSQMLDNESEGPEKVIKLAKAKHPGIQGK